MQIHHMGLDDLSGSLVVIRGIQDVSYDELLEITLDSGEKRLARIVELTEEFAVAQVFAGTQGISLTNTRTRRTGSPLRLQLSKEILGRTFDGIGRPMDGLGPIWAKKHMDIN